MDSLDRRGKRGGGLTHILGPEGISSFLVKIDGIFVFFLPSTEKTPAARCARESFIGLDMRKVGYMISSSRFRHCLASKLARLGKV